VRNVEGATKGLLKWAGIFAGVGSILGGLGLDAMLHLGQDVFNESKSARGLGLTVGQEQAFNISYARLLGNPGAFLSGINTGETDITSPAYRAMQMLGVNPNQPAGQTSAAMMQKIFNLAHTLPKSMLGPYAQAMGLGAFGISAEDMMRYRSMSPAKFSQLEATERKQATALDLPTSTQDAFTAFITQMKFAGKGIENVFVKGLEPLTGPLANLATGFEHVLQVLMAKNGGLARSIQDYANAMQTFSGELTAPKFVQGIKVLVDVVSTLADIPRA
jgi:hypothetical protein